MTYQISVIKLEEYGPWTLTLGSDREHKLQILQSKIYADLQELFSEKNGLIFFNRFDEFIAISNKISLEVHKEIFDTISKKFEQIKISISIGIGDTPLQSIRQSQFVKGKNDYLIFPSIFGNIDDIKGKNKIHKKESYNSCNDKNNLIKILHMDIDGSSKIMKNLSAYDITNKIINLYSKISNIFIDEESLTFFLGGDNFMIISKKDLLINKIGNINNIITELTDIKLNCGVGYGDTGRKAAKMATKALDSIRDFRKEGKIINIYEAS